MRFFFVENLTYYLFLKAVVNIPIQTLIIPPWLLLRKMIISQLELGPPVEISIFFFFFRTDFYKWYHSQWNSEDKKCENLLIARQRISCQQKQWRNFVRVDDFLLFLGAGYLPVKVICWNFFLFIAKIDQCG